MLRLGAPPSPVPTPFAQLLLAWINERDNMNTATNPHSRWLFPGRRAGQPMHPTTLAALIHKLGVPTRTARTTAIRQHLLEMPAAIVADALSYHPVTTAKIATQVGVTWNRYAPGDHTRTGDSSIRELSAPRGAPSYPQPSWEELGRRFLGLMANPKSKD
jgi:hypothetical protein